MHNSSSAAISQVPEITLAFWVIKILATTLGETGGDAVSMSMELGYLVSTAIFAVIFFVSVSAQIAATSYNPLLYWTTIIATTTVGTTLADFADRSLGLGYAGGSTLLLALLMGSFLLWYRLQGSISTGSITTPRTELFYSGSPSCSPRRWVPHWVTGPQTRPALVMQAVQCCSAACWPPSSQPTT